MSRISVPKLEVIRFSAEDVIVTSGTGSVTVPVTYSGFSDNKYYTTTGDELNQGGYGYSGSNWYRFQYKSKFEQPFQSITSWDHDDPDYDYMYTWFAEGDRIWRTESTKSRNYNKLPTN